MNPTAKARDKLSAFFSPAMTTLEDRCVTLWCIEPRIRGAGMAIQRGEKRLERVGDRVDIRSPRRVPIRDRDGAR